MNDRDGTTRFLSSYKVWSAFMGDSSETNYPKTAPKRYGKGFGGLELDYRPTV